MVALICLFGGAIVAFGLAANSGPLRSRFRTSEQIESELEVPCIAIVPKVDSADLAGQLPGSGETSGSGHLTTVSTFLKKLSGNLGRSDRTRRIAASHVSQTRTGLPSQVFLRTRGHGFCNRFAVFQSGRGHAIDQDGVGARLAGMWARQGDRDKFDAANEGKQTSSAFQR